MHRTSGHIGHYGRQGFTSQTITMSAPLIPVQTVRNAIWCKRDPTRRPRPELMPLKVPSRPRRVNDDIVTAKEKSGARRVFEHRDLVRKQDIVGPIEMPSISASRPRGEEFTHALDVVRNPHFASDKVEQERLECLIVSCHTS
jgi:hypothetical protein